MGCSISVLVRCGLHSSVVCDAQQTLSGNNSGMGDNIGQDAVLHFVDRWRPASSYAGAVSRQGIACQGVNAFPCSAAPYKGLAWEGASSWMTLDAAGELW